MEGLGFDREPNLFPISYYLIVSRGGNRAGRAGPKLARFFRTKILTAQPALKIGSVGPNSLFKAKKNSDWPDRAGPNLARFFSGQ